MFAVPLRDIVRIQSTSGTTGKPIVVGYTRNDIRTWSECVARVLAAGGVTEHDVVQVAFPYGLFSGGLGFHYGAERIGASVIPASAGSLEKQILIMRDFKTTALACTPSYALALAGALDASAHPPREPLAARRLLRRRALERGRCAASWRRSCASPPWTTTASPRSWARACPSSARHGAACT